MEFDTNYREDCASEPVLLLPNNLHKLETEDGFCFESSCSSNGFIRDLHHLDDHYHHQFSFSGSSVNPELGFQTASFDPFEYCFTNGCPPNLNLDEFYESKPFPDQSGGYAAAMHGLKIPVDIVKKSDQTLNCEDVKPLNFVVADEGSCITTAAANGYLKKNSIVASAPRAGKPYCKGHRKSNSVKGPWTAEEDRLLIHLVEKYGVRKWSHVAQMLKGRIGKQCRERWHNHLRPDIKKDTWSEEEDKILIQAHIELGNKWAEIAKRLPGRTENSIKNHWNATKRRQLSRRKFRSKNPRPNSLLQDYIGTFNFEDKTIISHNNTSAAEFLNINPIGRSVQTVPLAAETMDEFCIDDRLVPNFDLEVPDFPFQDHNLFDDQSSIESLLNPIPNCPTEYEERGFHLGMPPLNVASVIQCEVKKEMDLVEMITQANNY
ncbi:transcription factor MYB98-like [Diospyros lotus]|uniref:transcription factor MYB98-like n=1 Tax=Diospyros lotus TaxID=55363 RepID=UPI00224D4D21|nr:transcription factor MYB98-like [Diospyros lotus]